MSDGTGYLFVAIAVLFFGSNFTVTKKFKTGDGLFFQWVMACGIWVTGLAYQLYLCAHSTDDDGNATCPPFVPLAALGGVVWCTGNIWVVPIVKSIGLGLGQCLWGSSSCIIGWASGKFGILGVAAQPVSKSGLNYGGICLAVASMASFMFVRSQVGTAADPAATHPPLDDAHPYGKLGADDGFGFRSLNGPGTALSAEEAPAGEEGEGEGESSWVDRLSPPLKRIVGFALAIGSGLAYGTNFNPPSYVAARVAQYAPHDTGRMDSAHLYGYIFSHFSGIFLASTAYLLAYAAMSRNAPKLFPQIVLPGFASGVMWAIAQISFFYANALLSQVISFPIINVGPGLIAALWGVLVFKEVKLDARNSTMLGLAFAFAIASAALIALSK